MDERDIQAGDPWNEILRAALVGSRELALLASPESLKSEWVTTEWGAAWVLQRRIVPILFRCDVASLPQRLQRYQVVDFHKHKKYLGELRDRGDTQTQPSSLKTIRSRRVAPKPS
jgi:TIR domain-containing protein